jgi:hypothetical protein
MLTLNFPLIPQSTYSSRLFVSAVLTFAFWTTTPGVTQEKESDTATLFQNVRIFDGKSATLSAPSTQTCLSKVTRSRGSVDPITVDANQNVTTVAGGTGVD